jgi:sigma-B regulation protein RsbU (phosphoserine phosphatase)
MIYAVLNVQTGLLTMCRAGHNLPLIISKEGEARYIDGGGPPIGLGIPFEGNEGQDIQLSPGDSFIVFSDGINECSSSEEPDTEYGLERVKEILVENNSSNLDKSFDSLIADLNIFRGKADIADDVSIIGFRWKEAP